MGKKQSVGAAKQRPGTDITRFLERRAPNKDAYLIPDGRYVAGVRVTGGRPSTPGKQLLDNVLLSQDADDGGLQVVWASSPTAAFSPQKGASGSQESASQQQAENSQACKDGFRKTLIQAVQRAPDVEIHVGAQVPQPADDMVEQLLARRSSHRAASTSAPISQSHKSRDLQPWCEETAAGSAAASNTRNGFAEKAGVDAVLGSSDLGNQDLLESIDTYKTPGATRRARGGAFVQSADIVRPAMCTPSALTIGGKRQLGASGKASGANKRRALLDILDQVELMVKQRCTSAPSQPVAVLLGDMCAGAGTLPAANTDTVQHTSSPEVAAVCRLDAEAAHGGPSHIASVMGSGPGAVVAGAQTIRLTYNVLEPSLSRLDPACVDHTRVPVDGLTARSVQQFVPAMEVMMPTQPVGDTYPAVVAAPAANTAYVRETKVPVHAGECVMSGLNMPNLAPAAQSLSGTQMPARDLATQPLAFANALAMPSQVAESPVPANRKQATGSYAGTLQSPTAEGPVSVAPQRVAATGEAAQAVSRLPAAQPAPADDDDDEFWGDVDVDALVANATGQQPNTPGAGLVTAVAMAPPSGRHLGGVSPVLSQSQQFESDARQRQEQHAPNLQPSGRPPLAPDMPVLQRATGIGEQCGEQNETRTALEPKYSTAAVSAAVPLLGQREEVHFVVLEVEQLPSGHDKVLRCFNEYKGAEVRVCLRDMWADQEIVPGDTVNVIGGRTLPSPACMTVEVSATEGLLILHPDVLLSGTSVCTTIRCTRQAWLQDRVASIAGGEKALMGSMLHELLQRSLKAAIGGKLDKNVMMSEARSILSSNTDKLLESQQDESTVLAYIVEQLDGIVAWCNLYVTPNPAAPHGGRIESVGQDAPTFCRVTEVLDIEESIWAPKYGLKGQLDASLRVKLSNAEPQRPSQQEPSHFHGMRARSTTEGLQQGGMINGDGMTAVNTNAGLSQLHGCSNAGKPQHPWSASKGAPGAMQLAGPHARQQLTEQQLDTAGPGVIVPFEFKTGKDWHEHRAQVLLYLLLMEDRYQTAVRTALLWNSNKPTMQAVRYVHHELASLIMHRNRLAAYLVGPAREPPPPLQSSDADRKCEYCSVSATCALYLAAAAAGAATNGDGLQTDARAASAVTTQLAEMDLHRSLREKLSTVSPSSAAFFAHWVGLVDLEEHALRASRADVWALSGAQREQLGGCVAHLLLERELPPMGDAGEQKFVYVFRRKPGTDKAADGPGPGKASTAEPADAESGPRGLLCSGFAPGDLGLLGVDGRHAAAARVTVVDVTKDTLTVASRKELKYFKLGDAPRPTCGRCNTGGFPSAALSGCNACGASSERVAWRLDREEAASLFAQLRLNLSLLGVPGAGAGWSGGRKGSGHDAVQARREAHLMRLRKLIIDLEPPHQGHGLSSQCVSSQLSGSSVGSQLHANAYLSKHAHKMNGEQQEAVQRVLMMQDYAILLGMPGTGKTTTIVHIIRALVETRATILVASYTNSAVDNILMKLIGSPVSFVRLGSAQAVHPAVRPYMPGGEHHPNTSVAGLQELMGRVNVVGCTCLSVHSSLLTGRTFSVCILDEASQITLPASIGALALARSFLLVGDHYQLSPLVVSREASQGGLGISLFRRLSEAHPQAVVTLRSQYRMAADIMSLSNTLVYNGRMICGNETVAEAMLHLPYVENLSSYGSSTVRASPASPWPRERALPGWLTSLLRPECRVVFLDTDNVAGCREMAVQDGMVNRGEVHIVHAVASALVTAGLPPHDIGIASPYKAQVAVLQQALSSVGFCSPVGAPNVGAGDGAGDWQADGADGRGAVEVLTVDKYQGRDKPAILLSFVRCNAARSAGRLLADWQRLNVAITRARTKLLLVGSAATLASIPMLEDMLALLRCKGWIQQLPIDCLAELPALPTAPFAI